MSWYYKTRIGVFSITAEHDGKYSLNFNDDCYGFYDDPWDAADDVQSKVTGCSEWDMSSYPEESIPSDLSEWTQND